MYFDWLVKGTIRSVYKKPIRPFSFFEANPGPSPSFLNKIF